MVQLLETHVDLGPILGCHVSGGHDELVELADTAVLLSCFVNAVTLLALLLAFGAVICNMSLQVFPRQLLLVANIAFDDFEWTLHSVFFQLQV